VRLGLVAASGSCSNLQVKVAASYDGQTLTALGRWDVPPARRQWQRGGWDLVPRQFSAMQQLSRGLQAPTIASHMWRAVAVR
jgi:hypothetical protein